MKKVLLIVGSLRKESFNLQLAKLAEEMLKDKTQVSILHYADLPFMNQDIEFPTPEMVTGLPFPAEPRSQSLETRGRDSQSSRFFSTPGI